MATASASRVANQITRHLLMASDAACLILLLGAVSQPAGETRPSVGPSLLRQTDTIQLYSLSSVEDLVRRAQTLRVDRSLLAFGSRSHDNIGLSSLGNMRFKSETITTS
ncbi:hypothetical protein L209DRAFT_754091 [Thermothelomyces heterothallicus CBS 203.75]